MSLRFFSDWRFCFNYQLARYLLFIFVISTVFISNTVLAQSASDYHPPELAAILDFGDPPESDACDDFPGNFLELLGEDPSGDEHYAYDVVTAIAEGADCIAHLTDKVAFLQASGFLLIPRIANLSFQSNAGNNFATFLLRGDPVGTNPINEVLLKNFAWATDNNGPLASADAQTALDLLFCAMMINSSSSNAGDLSECTAEAFGLPPINIFDLFSGSWVQAYVAASALLNQIIPPVSKAFCFYHTSTTEYDFNLDKRYKGMESDYQYYTMNEMMELPNQWSGDLDYTTLGGPRCHLDFVDENWREMSFVGPEYQNAPYPIKILWQQHCYSFSKDALTLVFVDIPLLVKEFTDFFEDWITPGTKRLEWSTNLSACKAAISTAGITAPACVRLLQLSGEFLSDAQGLLQGFTAVLSKLYTTGDEYNDLAYQQNEWIPEAEDKIFDTESFCDQALCEAGGEGGYNAEMLLSYDPVLAAGNISSDTLSVTAEISTYAGANAISSSVTDELNFYEDENGIEISSSTVDGKNYTYFSGYVDAGHANERYQIHTGVYWYDQDVFMIGRQPFSHTEDVCPRTLADFPLGAQCVTPGRIFEVPLTLHKTPGAPINRYTSSFCATGVSCERLLSNPEQQFECGSSSGGGSNCYSYQNQAACLADSNCDWNQATSSCEPASGSGGCNDYTDMTSCVTAGCTWHQTGQGGYCA